MQNNEVEEGMDLVYEGPRGVFTCTVVKVEDTKKALGERNDSGRLIEGPPVVVYVDNGEETVVTSARYLYKPNRMGESSVHFSPSASMTRAPLGDWTLELGFDDSLQGGSLWGVIVNNHPEGAVAAGAIDAWLKQRGGKLTLTIPGGPLTSAPVGQCDSHPGVHSFRNDPDPCIGWVAAGSAPEPAPYDVHVTHTQVETVKVRVDATSREAALEEAKRLYALGTGEVESCEVIEDRPDWSDASVVKADGS